MVLPIFCWFVFRQHIPHSCSGLFLILVQRLPFYWKTTNRLFLPIAPYTTFHSDALSDLQLQNLLFDFRGIKNAYLNRLWRVRVDVPSVVSGPAGYNLLHPPHPALMFHSCFKPSPLHGTLWIFDLI